MVRVGVRARARLRTGVRVGARDMLRVKRLELGIMVRVRVRELWLG
jgi:hypothetical protein